MRAEQATMLQPTSLSIQIDGMPSAGDRFRLKFTMGGLGVGTITYGLPQPTSIVVEYEVPPDATAASVVRDLCAKINESHLPLWGTTCGIARNSIVIPRMGGAYTASIAVQAVTTAMIEVVC
jgi:hypothetical protein